MMLKSVQVRDKQVIWGGVGIGGGWSPRHSHNLGSSVGLRVNTVLKIEYRMTFFVLFFVSSVLLSGRI